MKKINILLIFLILNLFGCAKVIKDLTPKKPGSPATPSSYVLIFSSGTYDYENNISHYRTFSINEKGEVVELNPLYPEVVDKYLYAQAKTKDGVIFGLGSEGVRRMYYTKNGKDLILIDSQYELREWTEGAEIKELPQREGVEFICLDSGVAKFENQTLTLIENTPCAQSVSLDGEIYFTLIPDENSSRLVKLNPDHSFTVMYEESSPVWIYFTNPKKIGNKVFFGATKYSGSSYDTFLISIDGPMETTIYDQWSSPMGSGLNFVPLPDEEKLHYIKFNYKLEIYPIFDEEGNITMYSNGNNSYMYKTIDSQGNVEVVYDHSYESEGIVPVQIGENRFLITAKSYYNNDTGYVYKVTSRSIDGEIIEHFPLDVNSYPIGFIKNMLLFTDNSGGLFELTPSGQVESKEPFYPFDIPQSYFYSFNYLGKTYLGGTIGGYYEGDVFHSLDYPNVSYGND